MTDSLEIQVVVGGKVLPASEVTWQHGEAEYRRCQSLWADAAAGDDTAVMALLDFYQDTPPPRAWRFSTPEKIVARINEARRANFIDIYTGPGYVKLKRVHKSKLSVSEKLGVMSVANTDATDDREDPQ